MPLFGRSDNLAALLQQLHDRSYGGRDSLQELLLALRRSSAEIALQKNLWLLSHPERDVRALAADLAYKQSDNRALVDCIWKEIVGKLTHVRKEIGELLLKIEPDRLAVRIGTLAHSTRAQEREIAYDLIAACPQWEELLPILKLGLHDPEVAVRHRALNLLARGVANPTVFLILKELVRDEDEQVRRVAIHALAESNDPEIVEPFFQRLPLESEQDRAVMVRALTKLANNPLAKLEERVIPNLGDENPAVRDAALALLAQMPNRTQVLRYFLIHSRSIAHWLRDRLMQSFTKINSDIIPLLVELMNDRDDDVRVAAMQMASQSHDTRIVPAVRKILLSDADWWVRVMAAEVLARYPQPEIVELLISKLNDPELRHGIIAALGTANSPAVLQHLLYCLRDSQRSIRVAALDSLKKMRDGAVIEVVLEVAMTDPDPTVREKAAALLEGYGEASASARRILADHRDEQAHQPARCDAGSSGLEMVNESLNNR